MQIRPQVPKPRATWVYRYPETFGGSFNNPLDVLDHRDQTAFDLTAVLPAPGSSSRHFEARGVPVVGADAAAIPEIIEDEAPVKVRDRGTWRSVLGMSRN